MPVRQEPAGLLANKPQIKTEEALCGGTGLGNDRPG